MAASSAVVAGKGEQRRACGQTTRRRRAARPSGPRPRHCAVATAALEAPSATSHFPPVLSSLPCAHCMMDSMRSAHTHGQAQRSIRTLPAAPATALETRCRRDTAAPPVAVPDPSCAVGAIDRRLGGRVWELWASPWLAGVTVAVVRWLPPPPPPLRAGRRRRHHTDTRRMEGGTPRARPAHGQRVPPPRSPWVSLVCWRGGLAGGRQSQQTVAKNRA